MINLKRLLYAAASLFLPSAAFSQISLPQNTIVTENFNALGSSATASLPADWKMSSAGTGASATYASGSNVTATTQAANGGLPSAGGRYNWATTAGTDRAIGFLTDEGYASPNAILAHYRNTTGSTVNSVTVSFAIERYVVNTSTASVAFFYSTDGTTWTAVPNGDVNTTEFPVGAATGSFASPRSITRGAGIAVTVPNNGDVYFRWVFTNTGGTAAQGLGLDNVSVYAGTATPVLTAKLRDILQVDNGNQNQYNVGDVIRYQTVIKNIGSGAAGNVQLNIPPPSNTALVPGSIKTSAVAVDDKYGTSFNTPLSGTSVLVNDFGMPSPTAVLTYGPSANAALYNAGIAGTTDAGGSIILTAAGTFTYTPPTGFTGIDYFKYIAGNGNLPNNDAVVTISVAPDIAFTTTTIDPLCNGGTTGSITFNASGGSGTLQYSITGAGGTYQASNVFSGLAAGTYNLAVKDVVGYTKTTTITLTNPASITVSGDITNQVYNTAMTPVTFTKTGGTGTITWSLSGQPTGITISNSTGQVSGTPTQTGSFTAIITATDVNGCTGSINDAFTVAPNLTNDSYTAVGNTQLVADAHSSPATPFSTSATNITTNDQANAAISVTAGTFATTNGGSITIDAAGKFTYSPAKASNAVDSYTYTATSNGVSATATISFIVANMVWYVNNTYAGANGTPNGTSHRPYPFTDSATAASSPNQIIYVHSAPGIIYAPVILKSGQTLRGAGTALNVGALSIPAGTKPTLGSTITLANNVTIDGIDMSNGSVTAFTNAGATVTGVIVNVGNVTTTTGSGISLTGTGNNVTMTLASLSTSSAVNAVALTNTTGTVTINGGTQTNSTGPTFSVNGGTLSLTYSGAIAQAANAPMVNIAGGHNTGTITFQTGTLSATNGTGLQFDNADGTYNFAGTTTLNGGDAGIDILNGSSGTFCFGSGTTITNPSGIAFSVNASTANITYSGSFSKTNNAVTGISITNNTGGTISFNGTGTKIVSTATSNAVDLVTNPGTTINYSGNNLVLTTSSGIGFNATGGGTINVTGTGNTITSPAGTALNVVNTTIGSSGLTFQSISSAGTAAPTGIILNTTGSLGGLTVTGTGAAGSGGTIANKTGADNTFTTGCGIYLNSTTNPSFTRMQLNDFQGHGIYGTNVLGFAFNNSVISGVNGTNNSGGVSESSIYFTGLTGSCSVANANISGGYTNNFYVSNSSGVLNRLTFNTTTIGTNSTLGGNDGILVEGLSTATVNVTIQNCTFTAAKGDLLQMIADGSGGGDLLVSGSNFSNNHPSIATGGGGLSIFGGATGNFTADFQTNTFRNAVGHALLFVKSVGTGNFTVTVNNNTVGIAGTVNSGSLEGTGMKFQHAGSGSAVQNTGNSRFTLNIVNNQIRQYNNEAILVQAGAGIAYSGNIIATISGNTFANPGTNAAISNIFQGLNLNSGITPGDNFLVCFNVGNNTITGSGRNGGVDFRIRQRQSTTVRLPGYAGANSDNTAVVSFIQGKLVVPSTGSAANDLATGGGGFVGTPCQ